MTKTFSSGVTISMAGSQQQDDRSRFIMVKRRVRIGQTLEVQGHCYEGGAIVSLMSDKAFNFEQAGILERVAGVSDTL